MKPCALSTSPLSAATWLLIVQVFNIALTPTYGFAPQALHSARPVLQSLPDDTSGSGNGPASVQARSEERKIRANYFLQSSGFSPSKSIISTLLGDEPTADSDAKQFMAALEQSNRQALLERVHGVGEEYKDYVEETANEWKKEWEFRQIASKMAAEKAKVKQQERLDTLMAMVSGSGAIAQANVGANDGRLRFGMPYGERKEKKRANDDEEEVELPTAAPFDVVEETFPKAAPLEVVEEPKTDTPILSQIMEEKDKESDDAVVSEERIKAAEENTTILEPASKSDIAKDSKASANDAPAESITDEQNPLENLSLVQAAKSEDSKPAGNEAEKAAAEQRAANAKAAQEKADARKQQIIVAETKKKEEAKAQADAILNQAAQEARLKIEKEQAQAVERQKREEEDARLKAEEEVEKARKQKEIEELAKQQAAEEAAKEEEARLKAEEEARLKAEEEARQEAEAARLHAEAQQQRIDAVESKMQSLTDKATSVTFNAKLEDGLFLVGVGVRKKAIINVYSVAMYSSPAVLEAVSVFPKGKQKKEAQVALRDAARSFDSSNPQTTFVLEMTFKADGKTIASAIADSVKPRYAGPGANVKELESLIFEGVKSKGGQATKGTIFRFDCSAQGVAVSVDGNDQGQVECDSLGSAFVDVFLDDKAVSPKLVDSCIETWSGSGL